MTEIIGFCRFSFWGKSDYKNTPESEAEALNVLYCETRLNARFFLFENVCLASLDNQTDKNFRFVVITSTLMPLKYQKRLIDLAKSRSFMKVVVASDTDLNATVRNELERFYDDFSVKPDDTVQFRLDDDDGLAQGYIATLRLHSKRFCPPNGIISYTTGLVLFAQNNAFHALKIHQPFLALGIARRDANRTIFEMAHFRVGANFPAITFPKRPMYFQVFHTTNDTHAAQDKNLIRMKKSNPNFGSDEHEDMIKRIMSMHFAGLDPRKSLTKYFSQ